MAERWSALAGRGRICRPANPPVRSCRKEARRADASARRLHRLALGQALHDRAVDVGQGIDRRVLAHHAA